MAAPETVELRSMEDAALAEELQEAHQALFNLRFQGATRQLSDVSTVGKARKRVARIATLLREREILAEADAAPEAQAAAGQPAAEEGATDEPEVDPERAEGDDTETGDDEPADDEPADDEPDEDEE